MRRCDVEGCEELHIANGHCARHPQQVVQFGDGAEPWSVGRGRVRRWLHCRVDVEALPVERRAELDVWLAGRGLGSGPPVVLVTRGDGGFQVHVPDGVSAVAIDDLPVWLRDPEPPQAAAKAVRAPRR